MNEDEAIQAICDFVSSKYPDYPTGNLVAEEFESGRTLAEAGTVVRVL